MPHVIGLGYNAVLAALMGTWQLDSAVRLLHDLPSRQIHPDTCSFNTVMGTLARQPMLGAIRNSQLSWLFLEYFGWLY